MPTMRILMLLSLTAVPAGCTLFGSDWGRHYDAVRGVRGTVAASGIEARLEPPNLWPDAGSRFLGRMVEVFSPDLVAVRSEADGRIYRVRLAGAETAQADPANPGDNVGAAKQYIAQNWLNRQVVVEVPPRPERQTEENQIWGHIIAEGRCLDALLVYQGFAKARDGVYPRRVQMRRAEEEAVGDRGRFRPEGDGPRTRPGPTPTPMPMPVPIP
jgi:hypothetical protein